MFLEVGGEENGKLGDTFFGQRQSMTYVISEGGRNLHCKQREPRLRALMNKCGLK